jgi:DNA-binding CsgD family transcriptional regulator
VSTTRRPTVRIKPPDALTDQDREILRLKNAEGLSFREIGERFHITRQAAQLAYRRANGKTDRQWPVTKNPGDVHMAEVRVHQDVHAAAVARLATICDEAGLVGSSRPTLSAVCRELIRQPLHKKDFPKMAEPFSSAPPGSHGGDTQVVRWRDNWGKFGAAQAKIHQRGYSVSQVIEKRLRQFALSGKLPGALRYYQTGDEG